MAKFIVFEGIDGSGKTTVALKTVEYLKDYKDVFFTKEPSVSKIGKYIKKLLKTDNDPKSNAKKYLDLYVKDRKEHNKIIKKQLDLNNIVVCDRYYYSTIAYQSTQGLNPYLIIGKNKEFIVPDVTFIIDVPAKLALKRLSSRGKKIEKFEKLKFLEELRENYLKMPQYGKVLDKKRKNKKENIVIIDGSPKPEVVFEKVKAELKKL